MPITRVLDSFDNNEQVLRWWLHSAPPEDVGPVVCGYIELLAMQENDDITAPELARQVIKSRLSTACSCLASLWMMRWAAQTLWYGPHEGQQPQMQ